MSKLMGRLVSVELHGGRKGMAGAADVTVQLSAPCEALTHSQTWCWTRR